MFGLQAATIHWWDSTIHWSNSSPLCLAESNNCCVLIWKHSMSTDCPGIGWLFLAPPTAWFNSGHLQPLLMKIGLCNLSLKGCNKFFTNSLRLSIPSLCGRLPNPALSAYCKRNSSQSVKLLDICAIIYTYFTLLYLNRNLRTVSYHYIILNDSEKVTLHYLTALKVKEPRL